MDNHRGKNCCLPQSDTRETEQRHLDSATGSSLAPAVLHKEDQSCNFNTWGCQISQLYGKHMSVFFWATVRMLALIISSSELIKFLERSQQIGEEVLWSFPLLCWVLAWVTLMTSGWIQLKDNWGLWGGRIWLYLMAFCNNFSLNTMRDLSASNYFNFLSKTASEIVVLVELEMWSALFFLKKSRIKIILHNFCLFVF